MIAVWKFEDGRCQFYALKSAARMFEITLIGEPLEAWEVGQLMGGN